MPKIIDLRSDTVTRPSREMRQAIAEAEVGDDVFEDDLTVKKLEQKTAEILGKEAALFVPSGTMANQVSLRTLCDPGDEVICERGMHIVNYEVAAAAALSGIMLSPYDGVRGRLSAGQILSAIRSPDIHNPNTKIIALENTHNRAGGAVLDPDYISQVAAIAGEHSLLMYLDGARLWNAAVALNIKPAEITGYFDLVSVCFSKGLGAPIGSAVCGNGGNIAAARRIRKMLGGGMRQVGIIAQAALYALENNYNRLKEDHIRAKEFARQLSAIKGITLNINDVETNIVVFKVDVPIDDFLKKAASRGVLMVPFGQDRVRAVIHLDTKADDIPAAAKVLTDVLSAY
jgi:threonine aldolase